MPPDPRSRYVTESSPDSRKQLQPREEPRPPAIKRARSLLYTQGVVWALLTLAYGSTSQTQGPGGQTGSPGGMLIALAVAIITGSLAAGKMVLARALWRGSELARQTAIATEFAMAFFGLLIMVSPFLPSAVSEWVFSPLPVDASGGAPGDIIFLPLLFAVPVGAVLSLTAAIGLLRRRARNYCETWDGHAPVYRTQPPKGGSGSAAGFLAGPGGGVYACRC